MRKRRTSAKTLLFSLVILLFLSACSRQNETEKVSSEHSETEPNSAEAESVPEEHQLDHRFNVAGGVDVFIPSLWVLYNGSKNSVTLNSATWQVDGSEEEFNLPGYSPLFSIERLDPISKAKDKTEMELAFSFEPEKIVIHRFSVEYIDISDDTQNFEEIAVNDLRFSIEENSIYEIFATFPQGSASYLLYIE